MGDAGPGKGKVAEHEDQREAAEGSEGKGVVPRSGGEDEIERDPEDAAPVLRVTEDGFCLLYTSPSPRDGLLSRMPSSA